MKNNMYERKGMCKEGKKGKMRELASGLYRVGRCVECKGNEELCVGAVFLWWLGKDGSPHLHLEGRQCGECGGGGGGGS